MSTPLSIKIDRSSPIPYHTSRSAGHRRRHSRRFARLRHPPVKRDRAGPATSAIAPHHSRAAMDDLVQSGLLVRKRGVGTQVVSSQIRRHLELSSLNDDPERAGKKAVHLPAQLRAHSGTRADP